MPIDSRRALGLIALTALTVVGCHHAARPRGATEAAPAAAHAPAPAAAYAVYAAAIERVLQASRSAAAPLLVADSTVVGAGEMDALLRSMSDSLSPALRAAYETALRTRSVLRDSIPLAAVRVVPRGHIYAFFRQHGPDGWLHYYERYGTTGFVELTSVGFPPDSSQAVLYMAHHCGGLCGTGYVVVLARGAGGAWVVRSARMLWVS